MRSATLSYFILTVESISKVFIAVAVGGATIGFVLISIIFTMILISIWKYQKKKGKTSGTTVAEKGHSKLPISRFAFLNWSFPNSYF